MAWRSLSSFVSSALGLWLHSAPFEAAITHTTVNLYLRVGPALRGRTFVV